MSSLRSIVLGCVSEHGHETPEMAAVSPPKRLPKVKFGVPLAGTLVDGELPDPLVDIIVYIARDGVATSDLFRRPGSHSDLKVIVRRLAEGYPIQLSDYNFYTLASVVKMFLLKIPGGLFGVEIEQRLLDVLDLSSRLEQCDAIHRIIASLPASTQQLVALLFGTWFRVVNHCEYNAMTSEAMAKSIAGSVFHTCAAQPAMVNNAVRLIRIIIDNFGAAGVLGRTNVQYFTEQTCTAIKVREKFKYQLTGTCPFLTSNDNDVFRVECADECQRLFARVIASDAACRGFDPALNAVSEKEFYGCGIRPASIQELYSHRMFDEANSTTSPELCRTSPSLSLCMQNSLTLDDHGQHSKLTHLSSLSAPDVNKGCESPTQEVNTPPGGGSTSFESSSLSRYDSVQRRQLQRMRKRSDWFLSPTMDGSNEQTRPDDTDVLCAEHECTSSSMAELSANASVHLPQLRIHDFDATATSACNSPALPSLLINACRSPQHTSAQNSTSSPYIDSDSLPPSTNCLPDMSSDGSPLLADAALDPDAQYFIVDNFYGNTTVIGKTTAGDRF